MSAEFGSKEAAADAKKVGFGVSGKVVYREYSDDWVIPSAEEVKDAFLEETPFGTVIKTIKEAESRLETNR